MHNLEEIRTRTFYRLRHEVGTKDGWLKIYLHKEENGSPVWVSNPKGASEYSKQTAIDLWYFFRWGYRRSDN